MPTILFCKVHCIHSNVQCFWKGSIFDFHNNLYRDIRPNRSRNNAHFLNTDNTQARIAQALILVSWRYLLKTYFRLTLFYHNISFLGMFHINIDYAIVVANRYQELKEQMHHRDAIIETMNFAFPTIITSGTILAVAGTLIGMMTSTASITGIGQNLGRGTVISILLVMFVLPQILMVGGKIVDMTAFEMPNVTKKHTARGRVKVDGMVRGEIRGVVSGIVHATVDGEVDLSLISGAASEEDEDETESYR